MLQCARTVEGYSLTGDEWLELRRFGGDDFADVPTQLGDALRFGRVGGVMAEQVAVFLDGDAAAARGNHDRFRSLLDVRPPGIDVAAHVGERRFLRIQVERDTAAAPRAGRADERYAQTVEHPRGSGVGRGR